MLERHQAQKEKMEGFIIRCRNDIAEIEGWAEIDEQQIQDLENAIARCNAELQTEEQKLCLLQKELNSKLQDEIFFNTGFSH